LDYWQESEQALGHGLPGKHAPATDDWRFDLPQTEHPTAIGNQLSFRPAGIRIPATAESAKHAQQFIETPFVALVQRPEENDGFVKLASVRGMNTRLVNPKMSKRFEPLAPAFQGAANSYRRGTRPGIRSPNTRANEFSRSIVLERKRGVSQKEGTRQDMGLVISEAEQVFK
jgi:hypothetical protein